MKLLKGFNFTKGKRLRMSNVVRTIVIAVVSLLVIAAIVYVFFF